MPKQKQSSKTPKAACERAPRHAPLTSRVDVCHVNTDLKPENLVKADPNAEAPAPWHATVGPPGQNRKNGLEYVANHIEIATRNKIMAIAVLALTEEPAPPPFASDSRPTHRARSLLSRVPAPPTACRRATRRPRSRTRRTCGLPDARSQIAIHWLGERICQSFDHPHRLRHLGGGCRQIGWLSRRFRRRDRLLSLCSSCDRGYSAPLPLGGLGVRQQPLADDTQRRRRLERQIFSYDKEAGRERVGGVFCVTRTPNRCAAAARARSVQAGPEAPRRVCPPTRAPA